jgi:2-polyprenyl-3-methyl-5-hydroxy-6-metoxy-1,4-benzoquinol methylase
MARWWSKGIDDRHERTFWMFEHALGRVTGKNVLELGCGNGVTSNHWAKMGANVTAVDISPDLVATARKFANPAITFIVHNVLTFALPGQKFDIITMVDSFEHIQMKDWATLFKVLTAHAKHGTVLYLSFPAIEYQLAHYTEVCPYTACCYKVPTSLCNTLCR